MSKTVNTPNGVQFINTALPDIIEIRNVTQTYVDVDDKKKTSTIIQNCNLLIEESGNGQFVVLVGNSGCGKTSLLRYICGIQKPTSGEIFLRGKLITPKDHIGMVFQQYSSFEWRTVYQNVAFGLELQGTPKKEIHDKVMTMLETVDLIAHKDKYAKGPALSGGQLQRVAIARSLVVNNQILLLDEPFGALDINTRLKMQDMLLKIKETVKPTIILVTHDMEEAVYLADDIYIMKPNPGIIWQHMEVNLSHRTKDIKKTQAFLNLKNELEDKMEALPT